MVLYIIFILCPLSVIVDILSCPVAPNASDTDRCGLRLADGNSTFGVLEVSLDGRWWSICSRAFSTAAANIACRQLGFSGGAVAVYTDGR